VSYPRGSVSSASELGRLQILEVANFSLAGLFILLQLVQFFILPIYLLPKASRWEYLVIPLAFTITPLWALLHEAIHGVFNSSSRLNRIFGRMLAICFGSPFNILRLTHLSHHKFNRAITEKGTEIYDPANVSCFRASIQYFYYIFCGLYLVEVSSIFIFFLPPKIFARMRSRLLNQGSLQEKWLAAQFTDEAVVRQTQIDGLVIYVILALSACCFGQHWRIFAALLILRTFLVSFHDNVYHYGTPLGVTASGHNLFMPWSISRLVLNFNLHRIHHCYPNVPWIQLPEYFVRLSGVYDQHFLSAALNQLRGPIAASETSSNSQAVDKRHIPLQTP
jgi:fatty acid desaturase